MEASDQIRGVIYPEHMNELGSVSDPKKLYPVGKRVHVRILRISREQHSLICTAKRTLLREETPILTDIEKAETDAEYVGTVSEIMPGGVMIHFFNGICGFIPTNELQRRNLRAEEIYKKGRIAHVRVKGVDRMKNRVIIVPVDGDDSIEKLIVGMRLRDDTQGSVGSGVVVKTEYSVCVYEKEKEEKGVILHMENDLYAFLPIPQISDHPELNDRLYRLFTEGIRVNEVGILNSIPRASYSRNE